MPPNPGLAASEAPTKVGEEGNSLASWVGWVQTLVASVWTLQSWLWASWVMRRREDGRGILVGGRKGRSHQGLPGTYCAVRPMPVADLDAKSAHVLGEDVKEPVVVVLGKFEGEGEGVNIPAKDCF
jgi:hypothetical protein